MKISVLKTGLLAVLLVMTAASRLEGSGDPTPGPKTKKEKKIVVASPDKEIVVDGDRVFVWGDGDEDADVMADLEDMDDEVLPFRHSFHERLGGGYIGVNLIEMTPELREHFGAPKEAGVFVGRVEAESPAAKSGIEVGDIVTSVDGDRVESTHELVRAVRRKKAGETVKIEVLRDRAPKTLSITVAERKDREIRMGSLDPEMRHFRFRHMVAPVPPVPPIAPLPPDGRGLRDRLDSLEQRLKELESRLPSR